MGPKLFPIEPVAAGAAGVRRTPGLPMRLRQVHRWTSIVFTLAVAANFIAMVRGFVPALITYSPLPPLLILTVTGLYMFARQARSKPHPTLPTAKG